MNMKRVVQFFWLVAVLSVLPVSALAGGWHLESIYEDTANENNGVLAPVIALDSNDTPHILFTHQIYHYIYGPSSDWSYKKYIASPGMESWQMEDIHEDSSGSHDLAIDGNDALHVCFITDALSYKTKKNDTWESTRIGTVEESACRVATDSTGSPYVTSSGQSVDAPLWGRDVTFWYDHTISSNSALFFNATNWKHARFDTYGWTTDRLENWTSNLSMAFDHDDRLYAFSFLDKLTLLTSFPDHQFRTYEFNLTDDGNVVDSREVSQAESYADDAGNIYTVVRTPDSRLISFKIKTDGGPYTAGGPLDVQDLPTLAGNITSYCAGVDHDGTLVVVYTTGSEQKMARLTAGSQTWKVTSQPTLNFSSCSMAIDSNNKVHLAYTYGQELMYATDSLPPTIPPTVTTSQPDNLMNSSAQLRAVVSPKNADTKVYFEYGTTVAYGQTTATKILLANSGAVTTADTVEGLTPGITYHYRVVARNTAGTVMGQDQSFTPPTQISIPGVQAGEWLFDFGNFTNQQGFIIGANQTLQLVPGTTLRVTLTERCTGGGYGSQEYEASHTIEEAIKSMGFVNNQLRLSGSSHDSGYGVYNDGDFAATGEVTDPNTLRGTWAASFSQVVNNNNGSDQRCSGSANGTWQAHRKGAIFKPAMITVPVADADGDYAVTWEASTTPGVSYVLQEATDPSFTVGARYLTVGQALSKSISHPSGATYYYRVRATLAGSTASDWLSGNNGCAVPGATAVKTPGPLSVPPADPDGGYTIIWTPSATPGVTYVLEEATSPTFTAGLRIAYTGTNAQCPVTGRSQNKTYYYRVRAIRPGAKDSAWLTGNAGCAVPGTLRSGTPTSISVPTSDADGNYLVSWGASATSGGTYVLEEATNAKFTVGRRTVYTGTAFTTAIAGRVIGKTFYYRVRAVKPGAKDSAWRVGGNDCMVAQP